jgi:hypothetical protein
MAGSFFAKNIYAISLATSIACGSGSTATRDLDSTPRTSSKINRELAQKKFIDTAPQLSADGSKVVFLSGRSEQIRAWIYDTAVTSSENNPRVILGGENDFGEEREVDIAPTGDFAVVGYFKDGKYDLVVQFLGGAKTQLKLTDDADVESGVSISYDGSFIAYSVGSITRKTVLYAAGVDRTAQTVSTPVKIDGLSPFMIGPVWAKGPNTLLIARFDSNSGVVAAETVGFATAGNPAVSSKTSINIQDSSGNIPRIDRDGPLDASATAFFLTETVPPKIADSVPHNGDDDQNTSTYKRERRIVKVPIGGGQVEVLQPNGFSFIDFSSSKDGVVASTVRQFVACKDNKPTFGMGLQVLGMSNGKPQTLLPMFDQDGTKSWSVAKDMCAHIAPRPQPSADYFVKSVAINGDATSSAFTMVYTSNFSGKNDGTVAVLGDTELYILKLVVDGSEAKYTVSPLTTNSG